MSKKFDIYNRIFYMDVEKFVRHLCRLVLRHQMPVWNYFVNSFYSVGSRPPPRMLLLTLSCSVELVRHLQTISLTVII